MKSYTTLATAAVLLAGCQSEVASNADNSNVAAAAVAFNVSGAPTISFSVPDMMCQHACAVKVKEALAAQPGVEEVKVDFEAKLATVAIDQDLFDPDAAVATLIDYQFTNSELVPEVTEAVAAPHTEVAGQSK